MSHALLNEPNVSLDEFRDKVTAWAGAGGTAVTLEWGTGSGPSVYLFPNGQRKLGVGAKIPVRPTEYSEQYADFLERKLAPRIAEIAQAKGLGVSVHCTDQQPVQVQRMRRREIEHAERLASAH
jgi:hypothetical protein